MMLHLTHKEFNVLYDLIEDRRSYLEAAVYVSGEDRRHALMTVNTLRSKLEELTRA